MQYVFGGGRLTANKRGNCGVNGVGGADWCTLHTRNEQFHIAIAERVRLRETGGNCVRRTCAAHGYVFCSRASRHRHRLLRSCAVFGGGECPGAQILSGVQRFCVLCMACTAVHISTYVYGMRRSCVREYVYGVCVCDSRGFRCCWRCCGYHWRSGIQLLPFGEKRAMRTRTRAQAHKRIKWYTHTHTHTSHSPSCTQSAPTHTLHTSVDPK